MKKIILPIVLCIFISCKSTQQSVVKQEGVSNNTINDESGNDIVQSLRKEFMSKSAENECVPWEEIIKKPEYQELSEDLKQEVRDQFFDDCLAKKIKGEDYGKEYYKFLISALEAEKGVGFGDYLGCVSGDCKDGEGTYIWSTGSKYTGKWKDYFRNGEGRFRYSNGDKYTGQYKDDKRDGEGTYIWFEGAKYGGQWEDGKMHGKGLHTWSDGTKYEGQWKDDKKHGEGTLIYPDGEKYEGQWENGKRHGEGILYGSDGEIHQKGKFQDDKYIGE